MAEVVERARRRFRSIAEKVRIVEESLEPGASVSVVARAHDVNANQVFLWRRLHQKGKLQARGRTEGLIPVRVKDTGANIPPVRGKADSKLSNSPTGSIQIELALARLRIEGTVDRATLSAVLECLQR
jgi:transposase